MGLHCREWIVETKNWNDKIELDNPKSRNISFLLIIFYTILIRYNINSRYQVYVARLLSSARSHLDDASVDNMLSSGYTLSVVAMPGLQNYVS